MPTPALDKLLAEATARPWEGHAGAIFQQDGHAPDQEPVTRFIATYLGPWPGRWVAFTHRDAMVASVVDEPELWKAEGDEASDETANARLITLLANNAEEIVDVLGELAETTISNERPDYCADVDVELVHRAAALLAKLEAEAADGT